MSPNPGFLGVSRRELLSSAAAVPALAGTLFPLSAPAQAAKPGLTSQSVGGFPGPAADRKVVRIFLCGDVMVGRGIDQILPYPCPPQLHEDYVYSAIDYVRFAERVSGSIPAPLNVAYIWGYALNALRRKQPDARIVNLETSITRSEDYEAKGINYRISPENAECLRAAAIDCCALANNHVLDWGRSGLLDTLDTLRQMGIKTAGAGRNLHEASAAAILNIPAKGRVVVASFALPTSGVPGHWRATPDTHGVNWLPDLSDKSVALVDAALQSIRKAGDVIIVSLHWGPNWGYKILDDQRWFAHKLIDEAGASIVHGHSSHHPKALEVYKNRLILYGCGDFLNDYEGIEGYEEFRGDLSLMYFVDVEATSGDLVALELTPLQIRRFRLEHAVPADVDWLARVLDRESAPFGVRVSKEQEETLLASWAKV
jgi:poly-gamma-glutamate synthesis protein (capsule biosynthesis protein)